MQKVNCPSCGAEASFRSAASVMAVCDYCQSTLLKDATSVKDIGKMAEALEDYSRLQITTTGLYDGKAFSVIGRIQLRYDEGLWNEWYVLFADGSAGWLSDASGQQVMTLAQATPKNAPTFSAIASGNRYIFDNDEFIAADVRKARCVAGEGELPIKIGHGWEAKVADYRSGNRFLTLDYSDVGAPQLFLGKAVTLADLRCQLLRSDADIAGTAGRYRGKTSAFKCPNCAATLKYLAGAAEHVVCQACHSEIVCSGETAVVLRKLNESTRVKTTLALGDKAAIDGLGYVIIGLMRCRERPDPSEWTEYLLFNPKRGFLWLVESEQGWDQVEVLNEWPSLITSGSVRFRGKTLSKLYEYGADVIYAAGSFNWRVSVGDKTRIVDYGEDALKLCAESSDSELNWSLGKRVKATDVARWFSNPAIVTATPVDNAASMMTMAKVLTAILLVINVPILIMHDFEGMEVPFMGLIFMLLPALSANETSDEDD